MRSFARKTLEAIARRYGYTLKEAAAPPRGLAECVRQLKNVGFAPATVIDVGVGHGTSWLYEGFPDARFELFEALDIFVPSMEELCRKLNARYHVTALGAEAGTAAIDVNLEAPTSSTMSGFSVTHSPLIRSGRQVTIDRRMVQVRQLDEFGPFIPPILLKLDVEGFELDVLRGAHATLDRTEVLISEVSVSKRHQNDASFGTFLTRLESLGFILLDIAELTPLRRNGRLSFVDAVFVRSDTRLLL